jgi:hypothetical protein
MGMRTFLYLFFISFLSNFSFSQPFPQDYFRSPLDIPLYLSGNFGELRSNHFHAGLDIKTQGVEGQKIYAVADGYVSRIKVSPYGYGKALYITHPNGYTSVYGHLQKYSDRIEEVVKREQFQRERFDVELFPPPFSLPIKKGELVAYSGNTGGSGGPHLHFEIRNSKNEHPYNPLFFGFDIRDGVKPQIYALAVYPLDDTSLINGSKYMQRYSAYGTNGNYQLRTATPLQVYGKIGFGIQTVDRMGGTSNSYGLHNIQLWMEDEMVFEQQIDEFAFHEGRYINSMIDYPTYARYRRRIQKSYIEPGNKLRIYKMAKDRGVINFTDQGIQQMEYRCSDLEGNTARLKFTVEASPQKEKASVGEKRENFAQFIPYNRTTTFQQDEILAKFPAGVLYNDLYLEYKKTSPLASTISPIYWLHDHYTPLHSYITVTIRKENISEEIKRKALIVSTSNGRNLYAEGGQWAGNSISVQTRSLGGYAIAVDTTPPAIRPVNIYNGANMSGKWSISVKINDDLSGINTYRATVDGKWILMEYDAKNDLLVHYFDGSIPSGNYTFELTVTDEVGNRENYKADFIR